MDDSALLREYAQQASESAFATVVQRHVALVYSAARRQVGDPQLAEDITQAVFIILAQKAAAVARHPGLSGWLLTTTRYAANAHIRAAVRRAKREHEAAKQAMDTTESSPDLWEHLSPLLDEAMASLGDRDRAALALRYFENRSGAEIGQALGLNERAAQKRVSRALEKLRKFFGKRGVMLSATALAGAMSAHSVQAAPAALAKTVTVAAVAKGAAAGVSTLTLVTGALKIMAWTKTKTTVIAAAAILLTATTGTVVVGVYWHNAIAAEKVGTKLPIGTVAPTISYGYSRCIYVLASDGSLWSWGEQRLGWPVLGWSKGKLDHSTALRRIGNDSDWRSLAVGGSECLAIKADGSLWGWGGNYGYQLGDGTKQVRKTPVRSIPGHDWKQAVAGTTSYGLRNDGTLWAWGNNGVGQFGNGDTTASRQAVQVGSATNWAKVWGGGIQHVGLQSDGSLWFWGSVTGDGNDPNSIKVPTRVSADTNWVDACFGYFTVFALKSDGTLWAWGNSVAAYVPGADKTSLTPVQIGTENDWQTMSSATGCFYLLLQKKDGSLWSLDASEHRTIKPAGSYKPLVFKKIEFEKEIASFAAGGDDIGVILTPDGEIWTWGRMIGEHGMKDFEERENTRSEPTYRTLAKPWRMAVVGGRK